MELKWQCLSLFPEDPDFQGKDSAVCNTLEIAPLLSFLTTHPPCPWAWHRLSLMPSTSFFPSCCVPCLPVFPLYSLRVGRCTPYTVWLQVHPILMLTLTVPHAQSFAVTQSSVREDHLCPLILLVFPRWIQDILKSVFRLSMLIYNIKNEFKCSFSD